MPYEGQHLLSSKSNYVPDLRATSVEQLMHECLTCSQHVSTLHSAFDLKFDYVSRSSELPFLSWYKRLFLLRHWYTPRLMVSRILQDDIIRQQIPRLLFASKSTLRIVPLHRNSMCIFYNMTWTSLRKVLVRGPACWKLRTRFRWQMKIPCVMNTHAPSNPRMLLAFRGSNNYDKTWITYGLCITTFL